MSIVSVKLDLYNPNFDRRFAGMFVLYCIVIVLLGMALYGLRIGDIILTKKCVLRPIINYFAGMFYLGTIAVFTQMDIISKPFSYCLPDRNRTFRKILFSIGGVIVLIFSFISFSLSEHTLPQLFLHAIALPITGLPFYFLPAFTLLNSDNDLSNIFIWFCFSLLAIFLSLSIILNLKNDLLISLDQIIAYCLLPLSVSFILGTSALWKFLGDDNIGRKHFRRVLELSNNPKADSAGLSRKDKINEPIENLFLERIINQPAFSVSRSVIGTFYLLLERIWGYSGKSIIFKIALPSLLIFLFGYLQKNQEIESVFITYPVLFFIFIYCRKIILMYKPLSREFLFPIGRSKQFRINLVLWIVKPATMMLWFSFIILASHNLNNYMPDFTLFGYKFTYTPLVVSLIFWPAVIVPVGDIFLSYPRPPCSLPMVCFIITLVLLTGFFFVRNDLKTQIISMTSMILISNGFLLLLMGRYWFRQDHV